MSRGLRDFLVMVLGLGALLGMFAAALGAQIGFAYFVEQGGGRMLLPGIALVMLGQLVTGEPRLVWPLRTIALCVGAGALANGAYWHFFDHGRGLFTANRLSAAAIYLAAYHATEGWRRAVSLIRRKRPA